GLARASISGTSGNSRAPASTAPSCWPATRSSDDLPDPDGPVNSTTSPGRMSSRTSSATTYGGSAASRPDRAATRPVARLRVLGRKVERMVMGSTVAPFGYNRGRWLSYPDRVGLAEEESSDECHGDADAVHTRRLADDAGWRPL